MIVSIDGSSGSGKGTLARGLCEIYQFKHIDSGLLYRKVAYYCLDQKISAEEVVRVLDKITLEDNVSEKDLRSEKVAQKASEIAIYEEVRNYINSLIRHYVNSQKEHYKGFVIDGRDIGSVVFPHADIKLFLQASEEDRVKRRIQQNQELNIIPSQNVDLKNRDERDTTRKVAPLIVPKGAVVIDTSTLSIEETLKRANEIIQKALV